MKFNEEFIKISLLIRQEDLLVILLQSIVLKNPKKYKYWKWNKTFIFAHEMTIYRQNPKGILKKKSYLLNRNLVFMFNRKIERKRVKEIKETDHK